MKQSLLVAAYLVISAAIFYPLAVAGFVYWDDHALFTANPALLDFNVAEIFTNLRVGGFFPLTQLSLATDHLLFGINAPAMHIENIILHLLNSALVYLVARRLVHLGQSTAVLVALIFAWHPLNVEAVAWITGGRKDLLCTLFYLSSVLSFERYLTTRQKRFVALTMTCGILAMMSKAMAVTLPLTLLLMQGRVVAALLVPFSVALIYLENMAQRTQMHIEHTGFSFAQALSNAGRGLMFALSRMLWPHDLAVFYDPLVFKFSTGDFAALALFAIFVAFLVWRKVERRVWLALVLFLLLVAPVLKLIPFGLDSVFNDRYLYLPGVALLCFFFLGLRQIPQKLVQILSVPVLLACAYLTFAQTQVWATQETLWLNVLKSYPETAKAYPNLTLYYIETEQYEKALPMAKLSVQATPGDSEAWSNLGVLYTRMGRLPEAEQTYLAALQRAPQSPMLLNNLGYVYLAKQDWARANESFTQALKLAPNFSNAITGLRLSVEK